MLGLSGCAADPLDPLAAELGYGDPIAITDDTRAASHRSNRLGRAIEHHPAVAARPGDGAGDARRRRRRPDRAAGARRARLDPAAAVRIAGSMRPEADSPPITIGRRQGSVSLTSAGAVFTAPAMALAPAFSQDLHDRFGAAAMPLDPGGRNLDTWTPRHS